MASSLGGQSRGAALYLGNSSCHLHISLMRMWDVASGAPFVIINTVAGGLMAYGLTGLRYTGYAIVLYLVVLCLQSLISNQLQIFCVWLTPNQVLQVLLLQQSAI